MLQCQQAPSFTLETDSVSFVVLAHARARDSAFSMAVMLLQTRATAEPFLLQGNLKLLCLRVSWPVGCKLLSTQSCEVKVMLWPCCSGLLFEQATAWAQLKPSAVLARSCGSRALPSQLGVGTEPAVTQTYAQTSKVPNDPTRGWRKSKQESIGSHFNGKIPVLMHQ